MRLFGVESSRGRIWLAVTVIKGSKSNGRGSMSPLLCNALSCDICRNNALPSSRVCKRQMSLPMYTIVNLYNA